MGSEPLTKTLPDPTQRPEACVVIWDGQCRFCRQQVERLSGWDWTGQLSYLSLHDPRVAQLAPNLTYEALMEQMWVVTPDGAQYGGADALRFLSCKLPALWLAAPVLHLPLSRGLWQRLYRWVAQRRYRLAGRDCSGGTCHLHVSEAHSVAPTKPPVSP